VIGRAELAVVELLERRHMWDDVPLASVNNSMQHFRTLTGPNLTLMASQRLYALKNNPHMLSQGLLASVRRPDMHRDENTGDKKMVNLLEGFLRQVRSFDLQVCFCACHVLLCPHSVER
jgi:hypothetical protein